MYVSLLMRKKHIKCGPAADRLGYRISIEMASQPCGGTIHKLTQCAFSQLGSCVLKTLRYILKSNRSCILKFESKKYYLVTNDMLLVIADIGEMLVLNISKELRLAYIAQFAYAV